MNSPSRSRVFLVAGSILAGSAVAAGAFGAHMLKEVMESPMLMVFETAVRYQMYHALGLCIVAWAAARHPSPGLSVAAWCFGAGIALFSGSLYVMTLSGIRWVGALTPLGGLSMIAGWMLLAREAWYAEDLPGC